MDKVVQQNASNSEESAAASEEMNAQAEQLREYVANLVILISGTKDEKPGGKAYTAAKLKSTPKLTERKRRKEISAEQVIPFDDDDDFQNF